MCLLYVIAINDLKGGYADDLVHRINEKELDYFIVVNKIDTLPKEVTASTLKSKIVAQLNDNSVRFNNLVS